MHYIDKILKKFKTNRHELFKSVSVANENSNLASFVWILYEKSHFKDNQRKIAIERKNVKSFKSDVLHESSRKPSICFEPLTYLVGIAGISKVNIDIISLAYVPHCLEWYAVTGHGAGRGSS